MLAQALNPATHPHLLCSALLTMLTSYTAASNPVCSVYYTGSLKIQNTPASSPSSSSSAAAAAAAAAAPVMPLLLRPASPTCAAFAVAPAALRWLGGACLAFNLLPGSEDAARGRSE